jgi:crotonobetainyl-CoA:carnitine CoA-transferase CaiB-like acyl-CoA transferase
VFAAVGGHILVTGEFKHIWRRISQVHGVEDPTPAGASLDDKIRNRWAAARGWFKSFTDRDDLKGAIEKAGLAWADVRSHDDAYVNARVAEVDDRGGGLRRVIESPYRFSGAAAGIHGPAPYRGEHNAEVLADWLGIEADNGALSAE